MNRKIADDCDQLLRDLEADMKNFNFKPKKYFHQPDRKQTYYKQNNKTVKALSSNNKQMFYLNKSKMIELSNCQVNDNIQNSVPSQNKVKIDNKTDKTLYPMMGNSNNQAYFDSLILLIENAAKNLSD